MIAQITKLVRVKQLKHDDAQRDLQVKRQRLEEARKATRRTEQKVAESLLTYAEREDAIFAVILGEVIDREDVNETQARVVQLEKDHTRLVDAVERAKHVEARLEEELEAATVKYNQALRALDKMTVISDDLRQQADSVAEHKEEVEVEDLFARPRERAA